MYLISAYFDKQTNQRLQRLINRIAVETGNTFMTENHVPPHMTISSVEARGPEVLVPSVKSLPEVLQQGIVQFVSVGVFFPYVMYAAPVLNVYLQELIEQTYRVVAGLDEVTVSKYYRPMQMLPHVTLGKTLSKEQMKLAFDVVQNGFIPFEGRVTAIGLAKTNPHEDVVHFNLQI